MIELKEGDVYSFLYNEEALKDRSYHCFDGQLVVTRIYDGSLELVDTYWTSDNKRFTLERALELGHLEFKCNLNDVEVIKEYERVYYADSDVVNLSRQHNCYKIYAIKKGATRSQEKMQSVLEQKIADAKSKIASLQRDITWNEEKLDKVRHGDITIYI